MKGLLLFLVILVVFSACAWLGYQAANRVDLAQVPNQEGVDPDQGGSFNEGQHNLIVVHVDHMSGVNPQLVSVWYVSLSFLNDTRPHMDMGRLYPSGATPELAQELERSFSLLPNGEPSRGFWNAVKDGGFQWENFLVVDNATVQMVLGWINGPGDYPAILGGPAEQAVVFKDVLMRTCDTMGKLDSRGKAPFSWGDLVPAHLHSNLRMEIALAYWNEITRADQPVICLVPGQ
jgi:hypothetical protein